MNYRRLQKIQNSILSINPDLPIMGDLVNYQGIYKIELVPDPHPFPDFESESKKQLIQEFFNYIRDKKVITSRLRRLDLSGCKFPVFVLDNETGCLIEDPNCEIT